MTTLTLKADVSARIQDYVQNHVQLSDKPCRPKKLRLRRKRENLTLPEVRLPSNADVFASRGDEWGALPEIKRDPEDWLKATVQPDGFVVITARRSQDDDWFVPPQPRPCDRPLREPEPEYGPFSALRRIVTVQRLNLAQAHAARSRLVVTGP